MLKTYQYKFSCRLCMHLSCSSHSHSPISVSDFYYCVSSQGLGTVEANRNICFYFFPSFFIQNAVCCLHWRTQCHVPSYFWFMWLLLRKVMWLLSLKSFTASQTTIWLIKAVLIAERQEEYPLLGLWPYVSVGGLFFS